MNPSQGGASAFPTQKIAENLLLLGFPALTACGYPLGSFPNSGSRVLPPRGSEVTVQAFRGLEIPRLILKTRHASARLASSGLSS